MIVLSVAASGCAHSFVRSAGDLGGEPEEFVGLLYKERWNREKVLPVASDMQFEARVHTDQGDQVIAGELVGGSFGQSSILVNVGGDQVIAITWSPPTLTRIED